MMTPESRRIENILASISDCFYALDNQARFIYLNPQAEKYFGLSRDELMGRVVWDVFPEARGTVFEREYNRVMENGGRSHFEAQSVTTKRWVEVTIYAQPKDPAISDGGGGLAVYFRDTTEAREAEKQYRERTDYYRLLVENAREYAIIGLDLHGTVTHWNVGATRIFGWSENETVGQSSDRIFVFQDRENRIPHKERAQAAKTGRSKNERIHLRKDGSTFWALGDLMALYHDNGELRGFIKILRDNTEPRGAEDDYRRMQQKLHETQSWLKRVSDVVGVSFWVWEPEQDIITYQNAIKQFFGESFDSFREFKNLIHPADIPRIEGIVGHAIEFSQGYEMEFRVQRHSGARPENEDDWKWTLSIVSAEKAEGRPFTFFGLNLDVTERKKAQMELEKSQTKLQEIAREAKVAIWVWDPKRDVVLEKLMMDELFGFPVINLPSFCAHAHPDDIEPTLEIIAQVINARREEELTYRVPKVENPDPARAEDWKWLYCKMLPGTNEDDEVVIYGFNLDVTGQKLAQEEIFRSEKRYAALVEATNTIVWSAAPDLSHLQMPGWEQITGQNEKEFQAGYWADTIHPNDLSRVVEAWQNALAKSEGFEITYLLRHKDGEYRYNTGRAVPIFESDGKTLREWVGTNTNTDDIVRAQHALRESERRYRTLIDASPQIVWESALDGTVLYGNEYWMSYSGLTQQEIQNGAWQKCLHPDDRESVDLQWDRARAEKRLFECEVRLWCASSQQWRWHLSRSLPLINEMGAIEKWIGSSAEIHERKMADELRQQLLAQEQKARVSAEIASRQKDEFLAIVSHELRTPLNAILGWSNLLRTGELPPESQLEGLRVIERNARAQAQIVDDILDVARVISGKLKVEKRDLDLGELARETLESLAPSAQTNGIELCGETLSLPILGDATRLRQVLCNLISNALKFTPQGGRVCLLASVQNGQAVIAVSDNGAGIDPEFLPHVFDRFRQADSSSTRRHGGLGLGLALVDSIVRAHGGSVEAASPGLGRGATFSFRLPLISHAPVTATTNTTEQFGKRLANRAILVVDDSRDTLELTALFLKREGAIVEICEDVENAKLLFQGRAFELVATDLAMPGADGYHFLNWIRSRPNPEQNQVPVVAVTAFAGMDEKRRVEQAGFNGFVPKPIQAEQFIHVLGEILGE